MKRLLNKNAVLVFGLALLMCVVGATGCSAEQERPIDVQFAVNGIHRVIKVTATADSVTLTKVTVNRGNTKNGTEPHPSFPSAGASVPLPKTLKFGEFVVISLYTADSNPPKEVEIKTDKGAWTFNF